MSLIYKAQIIDELYNAKHTYLVSYLHDRADFSLTIEFDGIVFRMVLDIDTYEWTRDELLHDYPITKLPAQTITNFKIRDIGNQIEFAIYLYDKTYFVLANKK